MCTLRRKAFNKVFFKFLYAVVIQCPVNTIVENGKGCSTGVDRVQVWLQEKYF